MEQPFSPYLNPQLPVMWQPTPEQLAQQEREQRRRLVRGRTNRVTAMVFLYLGILTLGAGLGSLVVRVIRSVGFAGSLEEILSEAVGSLTDSLNSGLGYLVALPPIFLMIFLWKRKPFFRNVLFSTRRKMRFGRLLFLISLLFLAQAGADLLDRGFSYLWQGLGLPEGESALHVEDSISMLIYAGIGAPVIEELLFRGAVMRSFQNFGKGFAILASTVLFSVMHGNFSQIPFAFAAGLVLGYTAMEYNIWWSIFLHFFNNAILADALPRLCNLIPYGNWIYTGLIYAVGLAGLVLCIVQGRKIRAYRRENAIQPGCMKGFFSAPTLILMLCYGLGSAVLLAVLEILFV